MEQKKMKTMDGNEACATVAYQFTEVAGIMRKAPKSEELSKAILKSMNRPAMASR